MKRPLAVSSGVWILLLHILALLGPFTFTWAGLIAFIVMSYSTLGLGITLGFHRLFAHRSFDTTPVIRYLLAFLGCLALQGGPISWVATHRLHHKETDKPVDPHSPRQGFLWAHILWIFYRHPQLETQDDLRHYAPDLYKEPILRFMDRYSFCLYAVFAVLVFMAGTVFWGWQLGISLVIWGCVLRTVYTWHATWLVNSATHLWGYQSHETTDDSRNNWWVALLTFGEGWHNNHHAHPYSARMGFEWFELDMTYGIILLLQRMGLVTHVVQPKLMGSPTRSTPA